jgi:transcriptional regulator with XRE-family HTH domain
MAERQVNALAVLLRRLRTEAGFSQEELADRAGLHPRAISDLERGLVSRPRKDTVQLLADALSLEGRALAEFEIAAGRRPHVPSVDPKSWLDRVVGALDELGVAASRSVVAQWRTGELVDDAWLTWVDRLISLTADGRMQPIADRPLPVVGADPLFGRGAQEAELGAFLERVKQGRGGLALIVGPAGIGKSHLLGSYLASRSSGIRIEWATLERDEAGYRGWRRLLAPLWATVRRTELAPASLLAYAETLDDILLVSSDGETVRHFPGAVAAAVAALLDHAAIRHPLVLVIDDAHRGGASSDQLLFDVSPLLSASKAGIVAALRQDEVEDTSPISAYGHQAQDRAALDVVVPIHVPPLDIEATACLLDRLTGRVPPREIVEEVILQTGGRPQLIRYTPVHVPGSAEVSGPWTVGKLGAQGLQVLESTIQSRPPAVREVLYGAATCALGGYIAPGFLARVIELPVDEVERILDDERRRDSVLTAHIPGYRFQHDNWIDALVGLCPPARRHALHGRCLAILREDQAPDPHRLAWHAIRAGPELIGGQTLADLAKRAADASVSDYAFGQAAELYAIAAEHSAGTDRIDLLIGQADALRFSGAWAQARDALKTAVALAKSLQTPGHEAKALIHLERLTWTYGLDEKQITQQLREVLDRLPPGEAELRVHTWATLAQRLGITMRDYDDEAADFARLALRDLDEVSDPLALADCLLGIRYGLQDQVTPQESLGYAERTIKLGIRLRSGFHIHEALCVRIIDLIRCGRLTELAPVIREHREFARQSASPIAIYAEALIEGMLALARGEWDTARANNAKASSISNNWGESMAGEALMAQAGWQLYETGELNGLAEFLTSLPTRDVGALNDPLWSLGAGLIYAEQGDPESARRILREVCAGTKDLAGLPRGPSRIAILATAAMVIGHPLLVDALPQGEAARLGIGLAHLLMDHKDACVLAGWPAVILGSKHRFTGLALLAAGQPKSAADHLACGVEENKDLNVLHARTLFDWARALLRQPGSHASGVTEIKRARELAADLQMTTLVAQATAELGQIG